MNLSVSLPLDSSPGRRALGKEVSFSMKPICVCWKTSRNAKASPTRGGGVERSEDVGEVSSPQKQIPHTGRLRCGGCGNGIRECLQSLLSQKTTMRVLPP